MALLGGIGRFLDKYLFGYALGTAAGPSLEPFVQTLANEAWTQHRVKPVAADVAARLVAEGIWSSGRADGEAADTGIDADTFAALVELAREEPGVPLLLTLWRRGLIGEGLVDEALERAGMKPAYREPIKRTRRILLSPAELANAVVQGFRTLTAATTDAVDQGLTPDDFETMVDVTGLPPGPETLLEWLRRGITDEGGVDQGIREGHTKVKYIEPYLRARWRVLSATEYASLWLRGWITEAQAKAGGALTGYDAASMELLYRNRGRPATTRQAHIGFVRGGRLPGFTTERATFERAVEQSNVRTEWTDILWAQRYTYPSAFVLRSLTQAGDITPEQAEQALLYSGWEPGFAAQVAAAWGDGRAGAPSAKWADRARSRLYTVAHNEYLDGSIDAAQAHSTLAQVGAGAAEQDAILALWDAEQTVSRLELTPAQIKKAWKTGRYPTELALSELAERDYTPEDAQTFLDLP